MIKLMYSAEKTNAFRPTPWHWSTENFPAYRGAGARYSAFQAVASGYTPKFGEKPSSDGYSTQRIAIDAQPSAIVKTARTLLVVPRPEDRDEKILLITLRGGFRGAYSRIEVVGGEIFFQRGGNMHCCPTEHLVVRLNDEKGYLFAETGRRSSVGTVEIFTWDDYKVMPTEEFEQWRELHCSN